ncbi:MAG: hypothetical protein HUK00_10190, partial [Bacteroidaceae bacterium]|nr:hypothetical protein [Bacteroidaceae bacterium]
MRHLLTLVLALVCSLSQAQTVGEIVGYVKERGRICEVTPDSVFPTIREMERMRAGAKDSVAWAVISECLGVLYDGCVGSSQHDSQGETLEEWGRGQWREAAERSFRDARRPLRALRNAKSKDWTPFVELVSKKEYIDGSRWFDGDLLHVLQQA